MLGVLVFAIIVAMQSRRNERQAAQIYSSSSSSAASSSTNTANVNYDDLKNLVITRFNKVEPTQWGTDTTGVVIKFSANDKSFALTLDACGGPGANGYDSELIDFLRREQIPATLFLGGRWIKANRSTAQELAKEPLFEIENHGTIHRPCSANGKSAYGILGTKNVGEIVDEIELNARTIESITNKKPQYYRAGTAFTNEICPQVAAELGNKVISFALAGDAGATLPAAQIKTAFGKLQPGDIVVIHMNHPDKDTAEGMTQVIPILKSNGWKFVKLNDIKI